MFVENYSETLFKGKDKVDDTMTRTPVETVLNSRVFGEDSSHMLVKQLVARPGGVPAIIPHLLGDDQGVKAAGTSTRSCLTNKSKQLKIE